MGIWTRRYAHLLSIATHHAFLTENFETNTQNTFYVKLPMNDAEPSIYAKTKHNVNGKLSGNHTLPSNARATTTSSGTASSACTTSPLPREIHADVSRALHAACFCFPFHLRIAAAPAPAVAAAIALRFVALPPHTVSVAGGQRSAELARSVLLHMAHGRPVDAARRSKSRIFGRIRKRWKRSSQILRYAYDLSIEI
ncbi:hypothetical protein HYPSUDRAFT_206465 [Hypholoma sublateritium FD-334 SS-4]|uniref:Uncharacterized protein n=1 Tax=Hypholoma sublateritium (strain FD-334 SS-4) TaxID=945553 RepID=A0A0D2NDE5_HYPSF|nr:hypothetical protein HYPSUDRAFT_206465 [Hypholoma sublateritium FD-334 SS-4]